MKDGLHATFTAAGATKVAACSGVAGAYATATAGIATFESFALRALA